MSVHSLHDNHKQTAAPYLAPEDGVNFARQNQATDPISIPG